jgi:hypothetical protein
VPRRYVHANLVFILIVRAHTHDRIVQALWAELRQRTVVSGVDDAMLCRRIVANFFNLMLGSDAQLV